jgi:hypothetical protein
MFDSLTVGASEILLAQHFLAKVIGIENTDCMSVLFDEIFQ